MRTTREEQQASHVHRFLAVSARYLGLAENVEAMQAAETDISDRARQGPGEQADCCSRAA